MTTLTDQAKILFDKELDEAVEATLDLWKDYIDGSSRVLSGGPGSGFFGHAGRPGKRGGSAPQGAGTGSASGSSSEKSETGIGDISDYPVPQQKEIEKQMEKFRDEYADAPIEHGVLINDGGWTMEFTGDEDSVDVELSPMDQMRFRNQSVFIHNHPGGVPPSPEDWAASVGMNEKKMIAVGIRPDGKKVAWTITRPEGGYKIGWQDTGRVISSVLGPEDLDAYHENVEMFDKHTAEYLGINLIWNRVEEKGYLEYREEVMG